MGTTTPKVKFYKFAEVGEIVDVVKLNENFDKADAAAGAFVCTSTTRPSLSELYAGRLIFETDTKAFGIWDGTVWRLYDTEWQTYTPDVYVGAIKLGDSGTTLGNGTVNGRFFRQGKKITLHAGYILGTTTSYGAHTGSIRMSLPTGLNAAATTDSGFVVSSIPPYYGRFTILQGSNTHSGNVVINTTGVGDNVMFFSIEITAATSGGGNLTNANVTVGQATLASSGHCINLTAEYVAV